MYRSRVNCISLNLAIFLRGFLLIVGTGKRLSDLVFFGSFFPLSVSNEFTEHLLKYFNLCNNTFSIRFAFYSTITNNLIPFLVPLTTLKDYSNIISGSFLIIHRILVVRSQ